MAKIEVKDNQWWYKSQPLVGIPENCRYILLKLEGRECPMVRSDMGADGRPTYSFKFINKEDRKLWKSLRGQRVEAEIVYQADTPPELDSGYGDDKRTSYAVSLKEDAGPAGATAVAAEVCRAAPTQFDAYVFIDWSANSSPKSGKDSIWIAEAYFNNSGVLSAAELINPTTRDDATCNLANRLRGHVRDGRRVLAGFDFPFGYPHDSYSRLFPRCSDPTWSSLWSHLGREVEDDAQNINNRFCVASGLNGVAGAPFFWGCPIGIASANLSPTKPRTQHVAEYRVVESRLRAARRRAFAVWQLFGNGSVGSQALLGIPRIEQLRRHTDIRGLVWPFETGLCCPERRDGGEVVYAEIWPGCIQVEFGLHDVRDAAQMLSYVRWAATQDAKGNLATFFQVPTLGQVDRPTVQQHEGWILGFQP